MFLFRSEGVFCFREKSVMGEVFEKTFLAKKVLFPYHKSMISTRGDEIPLLTVLGQKIEEDPFRCVTACIFLAAVVHTFFAGKFSRHSKQLEHRVGYSTIRSRVWHWLGEVEVIFGLWLIPLMILLIAWKGWESTVGYFSTRHYGEPIFVFVIMMVAATRPILVLAEKFLQTLVRCLGHEKPSTWWLCILTVAPLFGSLLTEPAAMTIAALLLSEKVFVHQPSRWFSYATLGLLFVNVSVGGVLTHFAAPPILMVAAPWHWDTPYVFSHFGEAAIVGIVCSALFYFLLFAKQLHLLDVRASGSKPSVLISTPAIPLWVFVVHVFFLGWTVLHAHHTALVVLGGLFFLMTVHILKPYQSPIAWKEGLLVGCFLAGLVTHGGLQEWWIEAVLSRLNHTMLFYSSLVLTSFNDNASLTYLASLVPEFAHNFSSQSAVVSGAIIGGGLTVIANAPNPAGQSLLAKFFDHGVVKPLPLCLGALPPTLIFIAVFRGLLNH